MKKFLLIVLLLSLGLWPLGCGEGYEKTTPTPTVLPRVLNTYPLNGATGLPVSLEVMAVFSKDMDNTTFNSTTFTLSSPEGAVTGTVSYQASSKTAFFIPGDFLKYSATYTATLAATVKDSEGNQLGLAEIWSFITTSSNIPSTPALQFPANNSITNDATPVFSWSAAADPSGVTNYEIVIESITDIATLGAVTTYTPSANLSEGVHSWKVRAKNGNGYFGDYSPARSLTIDTTPPQISSTSPANGATGVARTSTNITATFNEDMDSSTINTSSFKVGSAGGLLSGEVTYNAGTKTATFTSSTSYLNYGVTYIATIDSTVKDAAGNSLTLYTFYFTTPAIAWDVQTVDTGGGNDVGQYSSIAVNSNGKAYISYYDATLGELRYATNEGISWVTSAIDTFGDVGKYSSIALDLNNKAYISYYDVANADLKLATNESGVWITSALDTGGDVGQFTSIAMDLNYKPHISYYDVTNTNLKYAINASGVWSFSALDSGGAVGQYSSIDIDSNNKTHISYYDASNADLKYATNASGVWSFSTLDSGGVVGWYSSIDTDSNNKAHISYYDFTLGDLKYATDPSGVWSFSTLDSGGIVGAFTSIAMDSNNKTHISYYDVTNGDLKYAINASGVWSFSTLDSGGGGFIGLYSSIAIDPTGKVHISYYDATNKILKYAHSQ